MSKSKTTVIALDVGGARIGVAIADTSVKIAVPFGAIEVDGNEVQAIAQLVVKEDARVVVVGYPRNQAGEPTAQTASVEQFAAKLTGITDELVFQDESLTSVMAEQRLKARGGSYTKGDIDAEAAVIILQDYIEEHVS
ncbi:MAG: Holliday junction resolvase YqgF [Candidatus Saccharibacteria bacterium]|nr:Holliday junction resolvase YqgF [Candidatus Saccharibacteria bacterium]